MNEILFRGKGKNGWVEGGYHKHCTRMLCPLGNDSLKDNEIRHLIIRDGVADWNMPRGIEAVEVDPKTVGQFTGLTDKNGKKIFEGDICRVLLKGEQFGDLLEIRFLHGAFCTGPVGYDDESFDPLKGVCEEYESHGLQLEAIGTIYDNPELLEGKKS